MNFWTTVTVKYVETSIHENPPLCTDEGRHIGPCQEDDQERCVCAFESQRFDISVLENDVVQGFERRGNSVHSRTDTTEDGRGRRAVQVMVGGAGQVRRRTHSDQTVLFMAGQTKQI